VGRNFSCFVTPDEFERAVHSVGDARGARLWLMPEGTCDGEVEALPSLDSTSRVIVWLGALPPGREIWNARDAALEAGFVGMVRPLLSAPEQTLTMAEIFTPATDMTGSGWLFPPLKRTLGRCLRFDTVARSDADPAAAPGRGQRCSAAARAVWEEGFVLRQHNVGRVRFEPVEQ
jgi:hypothetical protein